MSKFPYTPAINYFKAIPKDSIFSLADLKKWYDEFTIPILGVTALVYVDAETFDDFDEFEKKYPDGELDFYTFAESIKGMVSMIDRHPHVKELLSKITSLVTTELLRGGAADYLKSLPPKTQLELLYIYEQNYRLANEFHMHIYGLETISDWNEPGNKTYFLPADFYLEKDLLVNDPIIDDCDLLSQYILTLHYIYIEEEEE